MEPFENIVYHRAFHTLLALATVAIAGFILTLYFSKKVEGARKRNRIRNRIFYISLIVAGILLARIWIEGFTHLLAILGFVSAALVIANKESIMNLTGFFVILWRGLFTEDDLIEITHIRGVVRGVGPLYFTLNQVSKSSNIRASGRIARIPNGLILTNPVLNLTQSLMLEQEVSFLVSPSSDLNESQKLITEIIKNEINGISTKSREGSKLRADRHTKYPAEVICKKSIKQDKPSGFLLTFTFYCAIEDEFTIKDLIHTAVIDLVKSNNNIKLVFEE